MVLFLHAAFAADGDRHLALALVAAQLDAPADLGHRGGVLGLAGLEDFGHARQTAGNILRAARRPGLMGKQLAGLHFLAFDHLDTGPGRQIVDVENLALGVLDHDLRVLVALVLNHDRPLDDLGVQVLDLRLRGLGTLLLGLDRLAFDDIDEADHAADLGQNRRAVRVPLEQDRAGLDGLAILNEENAAVGHLELVQFAVLLVQQGDLAVAFEGHGRRRAVLALDGSRR